MNDILKAWLRCPSCGSETGRDVTFNFSLKGRCASGNRIYYVGDRLKGFPPLHLFEVQGSADFKCCAEKPELIPDSCVIQIAHGWIVKVVYPQPPDWPWEPLPRGRCTDRRRAAGVEVYRRDKAAWIAERRARGFSPNTLAEGIAFAISRPLRVRLDYEGVFRDVMRDASWPENYMRDRDGRWQRRKSRRLW